MSQIGSATSRSRASSGSLGQSITAGRYGSKVSSSVLQKSRLCSSLPKRIARPDGGQGPVSIERSGNASAGLLKRVLHSNTRDSTDAAGNPQNHPASRHRDVRPQSSRDQEALRTRRGSDSPQPNRG